VVSLPEVDWNLNLSINGPGSLGPIKTRKFRKLGIYQLFHSPNLVGIYEVSVSFEGEKVKIRNVQWRKSRKHTKNSADPSLTIQDLDLSPIINEPTNFLVKTKLPSGKNKLSGGDNLDVSTSYPNGDEVPVSVTDKGDGTYLCEFKPTKAEPLSLNVSLEGDRDKK
jgi:hypothetical protein